MLSNQVKAAKVDTEEGVELEVQTTLTQVKATDASAPTWSPSI